MQSYRLDELINTILTTTGERKGQIDENEKYELDKISFEVVHIIPEVAARLSLGISVFQLVFAGHKVHERRVAEICNARSL